MGTSSFISNMPNFADPKVRENLTTWLKDLPPPPPTREESIELLRSQILRQNQTQYWTAGNGIRDSNYLAQMMATRLVNAGITRLEDFGQRRATQPVDLIGYSWQGRTIGKDGAYTTPSPWGEDSPPIRHQLTPSQLEEAKKSPVYGIPTYDGSEYGYGYYMAPVDSSKVKIIDGQPQIETEGFDYYNKATGKSIGYQDYDKNQLTWSGTFQGDGSTAFQVRFNELGMPIFYTAWAGDSSSWNDFAPIVAIASIIPSPIQPFAQALQAYVAYEQGNTLGAVLGALGAASTFGAQFSTINPSAVNAVNGMDLASDVATASTPTFTTAANWLAQNAGKISTVQQAVGVLNALDKKNVAGVISSLVNLSPQIGVTIPADVIKPINLAAMASAASKGDWSAVASAASMLTDNPTLKQDWRLASKANDFRNAINTKNPTAMLSSFMDLANTHNLGVGTVQQAAQKLGLPMSADTAKKMMSMPSRDMNAHVQEYYDIVGHVKSSFKNNFGEEPTEAELSFFAENGGILAGYNSYVDDVNTTSQSELEAMLSKAGLKTEDLNPENVFQALSLGERAAQKYINQVSDIRKNSFDGSKYDTKEAAAAAAIKAGFNTFTAPDGDTYNVIPGEVAKRVVEDSKQGKNVGIDTSKYETINGVPLKDFDSIDDVPEIVITAAKLDKPSPSDAEAWAKYQKELQDLGGASFSKFFKDQLDILTEAYKGTKPDTFADGMKNALSFGARNFGSLASNLIRGAEAFGLEKNSAALRTSQALERWGKLNQSSGVLDAEDKFVKAINGITKESLAAKLGTTPDKVSALQVAAEQMRELGRQAVSNPLGTFSVALGEAAQEVPFLVVSGGVGSVASKVLSKAGAFAVARGTDAALNGYEAFSGNYAEVKDYLAKNGYSDSKSEARAIASGLEAMGVTMLTSWVGDKAIVKAFMGDLTKESVSRIAGAGAKEYVMGYVEGGLQNASAQIGKYGEIRNLAEVTAAATIEGFIQSGLTTGALSANKLSQVVARDYDGKGVTLGSILDGTSTFDPGSMNSNFELTAGFTIGDAVSYNKTFAENPNITPTEYMKTAEFFRAEGLQPTPQSISAIVGGEADLTGEQLQNTATAYADQNYVTPTEARQMLVDRGYQNPTQAQIDQFTGNKVESGVGDSVTNWVNQNMVTREEAIQQLKDLGYQNPPETLINKLVGQYDQSQLPERAANLGIATKQDVIDAISNIKLPAGINKADVESAITNYMVANPGLTKSDVSSVIADYMAKNPGFTAEDAEKVVSEKLSPVTQDLDSIKNLIGSPGSGDVDGTGIIGQLKSLGVNDQEIEDIIGKPATEKESATGLYKVAEEAAVRGENAASAVQKSVMDLIGSAAVADDPNTANIDESKPATGLMGEIASSESRVTKQIEDVSKDVQEKYDALTIGQKALADQLNQQGVDLKTAIDVAAQQTQQQVVDLGESLNQRVDELVAQGKTQYEATQQAIAEVNQQNQQLQTLVGTQARSANQQDIDALTDMIGGKRNVDLAYDVTGDKQITQDDLNFLQSVVAGTNTDWNAPAGSIWGGTGLYGQLAANEAQRKLDIEAMEKQRQADLQAQQLQARQLELRNSVREIAGLAQGQLQQIGGQIPQALRAAQTTATPIYAAETTPFDLSAPLELDFIDSNREKQGSQTGRQTTKIATGGYLDDLLDLLR